LKESFCNPVIPYFSLGVPMDEIYRMLSLDRFPIFWEKPKDPFRFVVEEITRDYHVLERDKPYTRPDTGSPESRTYHLHFVLQKINWGTVDVLRAITKRLRIGKKRFSYGGTKDRHGLTVQECSLFAVRKEELSHAVSGLRDVKLLGMWYEPDKIRLGDIKGNRFTIGLEHEVSDRLVDRLNESDTGLRVLNYYGEQRFGSSRRNTHIIGYHMLKQRYDLAVFEYLTGEVGEVNPVAKEFRKMAREVIGKGDLKEGDWNRLLSICPKHLRYERIILSHLSQPTRYRDYVNAIRKLPRGISLMFIHALQSWIFNEELYRREKDNEMYPLPRERGCGTDRFGFPDPETSGEIPMINVVGYDSMLNRYEKEILDEIGIEQEYFKLPSMPELSSRGTQRPGYLMLRDVSLLDENWIRFSLPSGGYATTVMNQLGL